MLDAKEHMKVRRRFARYTHELSKRRGKMTHFEMFIYSCLYFEELGDEIDTEGKFWILEKTLEYLKKCTLEKEGKTLDKEVK